MSLSSTSAVGAPAATKSAATPSKGTASGSDKQAFDALLSKLRQGGETSAAGTSSNGEAKTADETEDRFLKLLVAQMRNQDPLNPLDNAAVTTQLAQINTVRGIEKMNTSLQALVDRGAAGSATEAAAMVGRRVLVEGDALELPAGGVARGGYELASAASSVRIDVIDRSGAVVDSMTRAGVQPGLQTFEWSGANARTGVEPGTYTMKITAVNGDTQVQATPLTAAPVQAVARGADGVTLQLGGFGSKPLGDVRAIL
jgi:flagellar basal-body rod modification protein FlgD